MGGYHTELKNRLKLLKDVTVFSNPRFGIDRTIKAILESVRDFYDAEACLLVIPGKGETPTVTSCIAYSRDLSESIGAAGDRSGSGITVLSPSLDHAVIYRKTIRRMRDCST